MIIAIRQTFTHRHPTQKNNVRPSCIYLSYHIPYHIIRDPKIDPNSNNYKKYMKKANAKYIAEIYKSYDKYINANYKIDIKSSVLKRIENSL